MTVFQSQLPYEMDALEPYVSAKTLSYHYGMHHRAYVEKLNELIDDSPYADLSLEDIVSRARDEAAVDILNNAQQAWNHQFLWESMSPNGENEPNGRIKEMLENSFGDIDAFKQRFKDMSLAHFGSGWVWLVLDGMTLRILTTRDADSPVGTQMVPLLTLDVWEHAYYLDYQNERKRYVEAFLDKLINWKFAAANLQKADLKKVA